jgi:hypothetical protein
MIHELPKFTGSKITMKCESCGRPAIHGRLIPAAQVVTTREFWNDCFPRSRKPTLCEHCCYSGDCDQVRRNVIADRRRLARISKCLP